MRETPYQKETIMNETEAAIFAQLKNNPGHAYVAPDGKQIYALVDEDLMLVFHGDFTEMSNDDINRYIVNTLS